MALPVSLQLRYWGISAVVFGLVLWFLGDMLLPFILGGAIAYLLDPIADHMERWGLSRLLATGVITLATIFVFVFAMLLIVPLLVQQAISLFNTAPQIAADLWTFLTTRFPDLLDDNSPRTRWGTWSPPSSRSWPPASDRRDLRPRAPRVATRSGAPLSLLSARGVPC